MLADAVRTITLDPRAKVLDICSGSGAVAIAAAARGSALPPPWICTGCPPGRRASTRA
jgi:methylase of polypeptide subunit release factors